MTQYLIIDVTTGHTMQDRLTLTEAYQMLESDEDYAMMIQYGPDENPKIGCQHCGSHRFEKVTL